MSDVTQNLQDAIKKQLHESEFDVVGIIPIPTHKDRMVRLRTLQEILEDFEESNTHGTVDYLIQVKPKKHTVQESPYVPPKSEGTQKQGSGSIYLANGKLNVPYLVKNADLLFEAGDYVLARNIYKTILRSGEYTSQTLYRMGRCFEAEGKFEEARINYEESITYHPTLDTFQRLTALLVRQNNDQSAAEVIERTLSFKDLSPSLRFELHKACGNCWTRSQKSEEAERNFKKALEIDPSADDVRANLGVLYLQSSKIAEAKRHFRDAVASNPRNHQALSGLGSCSMADGDKRAAHDYFSQSLEVELNNPTAIFYLVKCAYELKSYSTAAKILQEYVQIAPVNANLLYSLAGLQYHLGRMNEARATIHKILEIQGQHQGAKDLLQMIEKYSANSAN
jgi:tetratricopeptide (TPR) repeat protein